MSAFLVGCDTLTVIHPTYFILKLDSVVLGVET